MNWRKKFDNIAIKIFFSWENVNYWNEIHSANNEALWTIFYIMEKIMCTCNLLLKQTNLLSEPHYMGKYFQSQCYKLRDENLYVIIQIHLKLISKRTPRQRCWTVSSEQRVTYYIVCICYSNITTVILKWASSIYVQNDHLIVGWSEPLIK